MKLEVRKLNAQRKYTGEFEYEIQPASDMCLIPYCKIEGNVSVKGNYEIYDDDSVGVSFAVKYLLNGQCSYCLKDASCVIEKDFDVLFVPQDDPDNYTYDGNIIDLSTAVNDAILFSQPNVLLCSEGCGGIDVNKK